MLDEVIQEGDYISIDGFEGKVYKGDIPVVASEVIQVMQGNMKELASERYLIFSTIFCSSARILNPNFKWIVMLLFTKSLTAGKATKKITG